MGADTFPISWPLRFRRWLWLFGFDRNPMRRRTDRIQAITRAALLVALLAGAPTAAVWIGHAVYTSGLQAARAQAATWRRVPGMVLRGVSWMDLGAGGAGVPGWPTAPRSLSVHQG
jgi:hypothetical protein